MSLLLLLRNHQDGTTPPPTSGDDDGGPGGELIWPADTSPAPGRPRIPVVIRPDPIGKPKKILDLTDEELLFLLGEL